MTRRLLALCGVLALLFTLGCGNKGPLYLPSPAGETQMDPDAEATAGN
jgi:predicted small lipoprotein YifL